MTIYYKNTYPQFSAEAVQGSCGVTIAAVELPSQVVAFTIDGGSQDEADNLNRYMADLGFEPVN